MTLDPLTLMLSHQAVYMEGTDLTVNKLRLEIRFPGISSVKFWRFTGTTRLYVLKRSVKTLPRHWMNLQFDIYDISVQASYWLKILKSDMIAVCDLCLLITWMIILNSELPLVPFRRQKGTCIHSWVSLCEGKRTFFSFPGNIQEPLKIKTGGTYSY